MKTRGTSTILHLTGKMKRPTIAMVYRAKRRVRPAMSFICFSVLFSILIATAFYTASSASSRNKAAHRAAPQPAVASFSAAGQALTSRQKKTVLATTATDLNPFGTNTLFPLLVPQAAPSPETIDTFAVVGGVCTNTPQDSFNLGDQVCAKVANAPLRSGAPLRRVSIGGTDGSVASAADIANDPQTVLFTVPARAPGAPA